MNSSVDNRTSPTLLWGTKNGDPVAWRKFVGRYSPLIYTWCRQRHLQEADAEDVTAAVLLKLAEQLRTFRYDPSRSFRGWLRTLTHHAWSDWVASQKRPGGGTGDSGVLGFLETIEARDDLMKQLDEVFDRELLDEASARVQLRVHAHTWEAYRLLTEEGLSGAEVAQRLEIKVATVFVARSKVQKMLQEELRRLDRPEPTQAENCP